MSGFWGIFRPDGGPVDMEAFNQMCKASEREGFDGIETHVEDGIAMGHLMLRVSPESQYDKQPLKSECGNYLLVGHFRLDYRDELGDKLGLTQSDLEKTPDSRLAMMAYIKWKEKCVYHLEGDWAFAIINRVSNLMFLGKDKVGYSALFYFQDDCLFYFSSIPIIFSRCCEKKINVDIIQLYRLSIEGLNLRSGKTLLQGYCNLNNSTCILIDSNNNISESKYYSFDFRTEKKYSFEQDVLIEFDSLYACAVRQRAHTNQKMGVYLSSGFDSTSVAFYLDKYVVSEFIDVTSYTSIPAFTKIDSELNLKKFSEESDVLELSRCLKNINFKLCSFPEIRVSDLLNVNKSQNYMDPIIHNNSFWINGILNEAKKNIVKRMLNGQLGNLTISWTPPFYTFYLLQSGHFRILFQKLVHLKSVKRKKYLWVIKHELLKPILLSVAGRIKFFFFQRNFDYFRSTMLNACVSLRKAWKKEVKSIQFYHKSSYFLSPKKLRLAVFERNSNSAGIKWYITSHDFGIELTDPTSDIRLIEYLFKLNVSWFEVLAEKKYLFKKNFRNKIPEIILNRSFYPYQSIDIANRLIVDDEIEAMLNELSNSDLIKMIFNTKVVERTFLNLKKNPQTPLSLSEASFFLKSISLMRFIKKMHNFVKHKP